MSFTNWLSLFVMVAAVVAVIFVFHSAQPAEPPRTTFFETKMGKFLGLVSVIGMSGFGLILAAIERVGTSQFYPNVLKAGIVMFGCGVWAFLILLWKGNKKGKSGKNDKNDRGEDKDELMLQ